MICFVRRQYEQQAREKNQQQQQQQQQHREIGVDQFGSAIAV